MLKDDCTVKQILQVIIPQYSIANEPTSEPILGYCQLDP